MNYSPTIIENDDSDDRFVFHDLCGNVNGFMTFSDAWKFAEKHGYNRFEAIGGKDHYRLFLPNIIDHETKKVFRNPNRGFIDVVQATI